MTHYSDLAPCDYFPVEHSGAFVAVGWLGRGRHYRKGRLTRREHDSLVSLSQEPYAPVSTRGRHRCELLRPTFSILPCFRALSNKDLFRSPLNMTLAMARSQRTGSRAYFAALLRTDWGPIVRGSDPDDTLEAVLEREYRLYIELGELVKQYGHPKSRSESNQSPPGDTFI